MAEKNLCGKMVKQPYRDNAYEVWSASGWKWAMCMYRKLKVLQGE